MRRRWWRKGSVGPSGGRGERVAGCGSGRRPTAHAHSPHTARRARCWPSAAAAPSHPLELRERGGSSAPWSAAFTRRALATPAKPRAPAPSRATCLAARPRQAKPRAPAPTCHARPTTRRCSSATTPSRPLPASVERDDPESDDPKSDDREIRDKFIFSLGFC